jgi:NADPH-dependent glutamate synthase beta subunit-like oxidoreductase
VNVRGYMELALQGEYGRALHLIKRKIALPGVISRICPAICEKKCNRAYFDEAIDINAVKRIIVDKAGLENEIVKPAARTQDMQVAVVGSGPAGLSAAYYLADKGYGVTVFEALPIPGGMLAVGISEKRLPRQIVEIEIDNLQRFGVEIRLNQPVGNGSLSIQQLKNRGYQAVFLATGAPRKRKMKHHRIPSRQLEIPHWSDADLKRFGLYKNGPQGVHAEGLRTKREGVFAGGDLVLGPGTVVQALAHGRCAADNIDRYLNGLPMRPADTRSTTISYGEVDISHFKKRPRLKPAMIAARRGKSSALTSDLLAVQWEAERCFKCGLFPRIKSKAG